jgi:hypothetical protein
MIKYVKFYIKICDVCQRTKTFKHFFYDDLQSLFFSKFVTKNNHEFHYKSFVKQTFKRRLRFCSCDNKSLHQDNALYFCHEENHDCWINKNYIRSCDAQIRRFERRYLEQKIRFYERILNEHLLSHEDEKISKHRLSFTDRRLNKMSKSKFEAFFTSVLLRKANRMNKILVFDWIRLLKQCTIHHWMKFFFCMYDYNSKIRYESKNDIIMNEIFIVTKRVKKLHEYKQNLIERW